MAVRFPNESPEYRRARDQLLAQEITLRRQLEAVARSRRGLPPGGEVPLDYEFEELNAQGGVAVRRLSELFDPGSDTLVVYQYMFPRHPHDPRPQPAVGSLKDLPRDDGPCPSCTVFLDQLDAAAPHVRAAGTSFAVIAKAPIERVAAFGRDRGWRHLRLLSAVHTDFKRHYGGEDEHGRSMPILNVFRRDHDARVRHFWSSELLYAPPDPGQDPRATGTLETFWNMLDLTPGGRRDFLEQLDYCCR